VGAIAVKQSVYVLPQTDQSYEDFGWILKEITEGGGDASLAEVRYIEGLTDEQVIFLFQEARKADYEKLFEDIKRVSEQLDKDNMKAGETVTKTRTQIGKLQKRLNDIISIDFFSSSDRVGAENALSSLASKYTGPVEESNAIKASKQFLGKVWVTRKNVFVDRIASAWLITRFIDEKAKFKFVDSNKYNPQKAEIRFDMVEAEFTHKGDRCTFEEFIQRFRLKDKALQQIGEIVHDIDLKDRKFERSEADGMNVMFSGIAAAHRNDNDRVEIGAKLLDDLYTYFKGKP
jgi:hypothetical protein